MKFISTLALSLLPAAVLAAPAPTEKRANEAITDEILFTITLPAFTTRRNALNPSYLDWTSDGCTDSPDNPLGFPYVPACNRHDFGYTNYRAQSRFTKAAKASIDTNFQKDLYYQCNVYNKYVSVCKALADVYHAAVVEFGGSDATKRDGLYEEKLQYYNQLVADLKAKGELPDYA
ncbi:prokaryotic phospholipase A2-domain-containing protein [Truncatella angustata]|uniref:Prokaryotic phospholipase A2-domain-containing protein n=1 Tax=Truncatella angustata TaxID=152316 RepID=A0A9P9A1P3_9PEZI|nr:prokaryotic phospholipase A2-domain-containing protein [Truncatella angustata]KAH6657366.1 prokaryotic phospholipase A2-domain-containing protein [Truncatella angustata]